MKTGAVILVLALAFVGTCLAQSGKEKKGNRMFGT